MKKLNKKSMYLTTLEKLNTAIRTDGYKFGMFLRGASLGDVKKVDGFALEVIKVGTAEGDSSVFEVVVKNEDRLFRFVGEYDSEEKIIFPKGEDYRFEEVEELTKQIKVYQNI